MNTVATAQEEELFRGRQALIQLRRLARFCNVMHTWERKPDAPLAEVANWIEQSIQSSRRK